MDLSRFLAEVAPSQKADSADLTDLSRTSPPSGDVADVRSAVDDLRMRTEKLALANMALWSLVRDRLGVTDKDLEKRIEEIDLADGKLDGKVTRPVAKCTRCSRVMSLRHKKCLYCGAERADTSPFDRTT